MTIRPKNIQFMKLRVRKPRTKHSRSSVSVPSIASAHINIDLVSTEYFDINCLPCGLSTTPLASAAARPKAFVRRRILCRAAPFLRSFTLEKAEGALLGCLGY